MKRNPIDWSGGNVVDTSALSFTFLKKYGIGKDSEKLQSKTIRHGNLRRTHTLIQHRANRRRG